MLVMSQYKDYGFRSSEKSQIHAYLTKPLLEALAGKKNIKILDVGCGNGWLASLLLEQGYDVYGTDASASGIAIANERHPGRFYVQDLTSDSLPTELGAIKFQIIISTEVVEHLYNPRGYVSFCKAVLSKAGGGEIIISTPYHGYFKNLLLAASGKMDNHLSALWDGGHIKFWSKATLSRLLEEQGFTVTGFIGCGRWPYIWKSMIITAKV
jgi:2-polyprenyl-3-methyl-5-hydroxy-6-metoxy-1,4-benzoquinol methylase